MSLHKLLSRRLSFEGCRAVGRALADRLVQLKDEKRSLPLAVEAECNHVLQRAAELDEFGPDAPMTTVDQGTDRMIAGYYGMFIARELCYSFVETVDLSDVERGQLELCQKTRLALFPDGTKFVQEPYETQWAHLEKLQRALTKPKMQESIAALGYQIETTRLLRWIERYGSRLGVTHTASLRDQQAIKAVERFHSAWEDFTVEVRHAYKDHSPESSRITLYLLALYDRQLEKEERGKMLVM